MAEHGTHHHHACPHDDEPSLFQHIEHRKKRLFLEAYAEVGTLREASAIAGCALGIHNYWVRTDAVYAEAFEAADKIAGQLMKDEARRRAMGYFETHYTAKGQPYEVYKCSDLLLMFRLKARFPDEFRDHARKEERQAISDLLKAVLLELADRHTLPAPAQDAEWAPLPPSARTNGQERRALPEPPGIDEEG